MIHYDVEFINPHAHLIKVRLTILRPDQAGQKLSLPAWIPGSYVIREFPRNVVSLTAYQGQGRNLKEIKVQKISAYTWQCEKITDSLTIEYVIYAFDPSVRGAYFDAERIFFNGSSVFLMVHGEESRSHQVYLHPMPDQNPKWRVATTLPRKEAKPWGFGTYISDSYDSLIDHPIEIGDFDLAEFYAGDKKHYVAISGRFDGDLERLLKDLKPICEAQIQLFGETPPFEHYLFMLQVRKDSYGGLEHRASSALQIQPECLPQMGAPTTMRLYASLLGLFSHEYFHAWNVKRIKPAAFENIDLFNKNYTRQLWIFEGFTSYYDDLALVRSKVISVDMYLDLLSQTLTKLLRAPGRHVQSVTDASFDAWIKFYLPNENTPNTVVNYYTKGSIIALMIDLHLRLASDHRKTLDNIMRTLWNDFAKKRQPLQEDTVERILRELGGSELGDMMNNALYGTADLSLDYLFNGFGLTLKLRESRGADDVGGKYPTTLSDEIKTPNIGCLVSKSQGKLLVSTVLANGPAEQAGIHAQDEILSLDGWRVEPDNYEKILRRLPINQTVDVMVSRLDRTKYLKLTVQEAAKDTAEIIKKDTLTAEEQRNLNQWLML